MFGQRWRSLTRIVLTIGLASFIPAPIYADDPKEMIKIGMIGSLFQDMPDSIIQAMAQPFGALMTSQTGVSGEMVKSGDEQVLGRDLAEKKVQLGVFRGIEFAWARAKYPELKPLVIAVNQNPKLMAYMVVRADNPAANLNDLKGKTLAKPKVAREHCHLFLQRRCEDLGCQPEGLFTAVNVAPSAEDALDDVVDDLAQCCLVDGIAYEAFKRRKPGRCAKLKVLHQSEVFPAACVAYQPGALDEALLDKFKIGMLNANKGLLGRQLLTLWKLTGFEPVPDDYEQTLSKIATVYPPPRK